MIEGATPTQQCILDILSDGRPHTKDELHKCLWDDLGSPNNVAMHISNIRKILRPRGEDVICEYALRKTHYRHVRLLSSAYTG